MYKFRFYDFGILVFTETVWASEHTVSSDDCDLN